MLYITVPQSPRYHQMTLDEFMDKSYRAPPPRMLKGATHTYVRSNAGGTLMNKYNIEGLVYLLTSYNKTTSQLHDVDIHTLYKSFKIPKSSGGWRKIDQPLDKLMDALSRLKMIFEDDFGASHHTNAYAYVKGRCAVDAVKRHQQNASRWFAKFDMKDFFGSISKDFVIRQLEMVYPFSEVLKDTRGKEELTRALDLCFLDGGLPQGTPISPLITNIVMIPIDYELTKALREDAATNYVYTRYADDMLISSRYDFKFMDVAKTINGVLKQFDAPLKLNSKKTRYGSSAGANWNLGVMLNKDNKITIGRKRKEQFIKMMDSYAKLKKSGSGWGVDDISYFLGLYSYYCSVEGHDVIDGIVEYMSKKHKMDIMKSMKADLKH